MSVEGLDNEIEGAHETRFHEATIEEITEDVEDGGKSTNEEEKEGGGDDYWHQVAKEAKERVEASGRVEPEEEEDNYWHKIAEEKKEADEKEESVVRVEAVKKDEDEEEEKSEREKPAQIVVEAEPTEEEKAAAAQTLSYWQTITEPEHNEDDHETTVQSGISITVYDGTDEEEEEEEEDKPHVHVVHVEEKEEVEIEVEKREIVVPPVPLPRRSEKEDSNVEVLNRIADENEEEMSTVFKMLAWAKNTRKKKTDTFVIRAKKKEDSIRRAVDFGSMDMVIEEKAVKEGSKAAPSKKQTIAENGTGKDKFGAHSNPDSGAIVTQGWIISAIQIYEQENEVEIVSLKFETKAGGTEAFVKAMVGPAVYKEYHWIIKEVPKASVHYDPKDKDTYMLSDLGSKLAKFVASKKLKKGLSIPFQPVIMADNEFAVFDDISSFKPFSDEAGFDLDHMKQALKALAHLHAISFAYFSNAKKDSKTFSDSIKVLVDHPFQPSASPEDKSAAKADLENAFENLLRIVSNADKEGAAIAQKAKSKFGDRLYDLCRDAGASNTNFSVLCHGCPTPDNIRFVYGESQRTTDVKFVGFQQARYAHAVTDLQLLMCTAMGSKVAEQSEFLLRFVYYETLAATVKTLGVSSPIIEYDVLMKDYRNKQVFGCLLGAMQLAGANVIKPVMNARRATGKRVFESKLAGKINPSLEPQALEKQSAPALRAKALLAKALAS